MKQFLNFGNIGRLVYIVMAGFWLGIAIIIGLYVFLYRKTPAVQPSPGGTFISSDATSSNDIELSLPRDGEIVKGSMVTIAGKTASGTSRVLVATSKGDYFAVQPKADGTFSVEVGADEGTTLVSAYVFAPNGVPSGAQKTFFFFPRDPVSPLDTVTTGTIGEIGTHSFILIDTGGRRFNVSLPPEAVIYRYNGLRPREQVNLNNLEKTATVAVVSRQPPGRQKITAAYVFAKPIFTAFVGRVKTVGDTVTLLPRFAGGPQVQLILGQKFRLLRYDDAAGNITNDSFSDLHPGDSVLVDARSVGESADIMELRSVIIVPD